MSFRLQETLLLVDLSYQTYRASAANSKLTSGRHFTGGLYGFMTQLAKTIRDTEATRVIVGQDVKPYKRSEVYPQYKQLRKKNADEDLLQLYKESLPLVLDMLDVVGIPVMGVPGFEFDDVAGHVVKQHRCRFDMIYAASNDSDLYQLFDCEWFAVYSDGLKTMMNRRALLQKHNVTPQQFMTMTALTGTHNDIAGIHKVGPVTARKAVLFPEVMRGFRDGHAALIDRNLELIKLPHKDFPRDEPLPRLTHRFTAQPFYRFCARYDITVTKSMLDAFEQIQERRKC